MKFSSLALLPLYAVAAAATATVTILDQDLKAVTFTGISGDRCINWTDMFPSNKGLLEVDINTGWCYLFHEKPGCTGLATAGRGVGHDGVIVDSFWKTHTGSIKIYEAVNGKC